MKVKMKDNLILRYQQCYEFNYRDKNRTSCAMNEMQAIKEYHGWLEYFKLKQFLKSIENKTINLVFTGEDAFEEIDNNIWLPDALWDAV